MCYMIERAITFHFWIKMKYPKMDEQKHPFIDENRICTDSSKKRIARIFHLWMI